MKTPQQLAHWLTRCWQRKDWREQHLLPGGQAWPLRLPIGLPDSQTFLQDGSALRQHLQQWQAVSDRQLGQVVWTQHRFRGASDTVAVPTHWVLDKPSQYLQAVRQLGGAASAEIAQDYHALQTVLAHADPCFHRLLVRRLSLWRDTPLDSVLIALRMAMELQPQCAQGKPLRALALQGNDSKFFERHASLLKALLDERFDGAASREGLAAFLGASEDADHWLLVIPLAPDLLPFQRLRLSTQELQHTALPGQHVLLVENEQCAHLLPQQLPGTIAVLGAGLDLEWLRAPWLRQRAVAYWGDMDTWGLKMLATARRHVPHLQALMMDHPSFEAHAQQAVTEPMPTSLDAYWQDLLPHEQELAQWLGQQGCGRLEQEFLQPAWVLQHLNKWLAHSQPPGTCQLNSQ